MKNNGIKASIYAMPDLLLQNRELKVKVSQKTTDEIDRAVTHVLGVSDFREKTRKREVVEARQIAMYFYKKRTRLSLAQIGMQLGNKDHATVLHACKTVKNLSESDKDFATKFEDVQEYLKNN